MIKFTIITAFPDFFNDFLTTSIVGRGVKAGLFKVDIVNLRSFGKGSRNKKAYNQAFNHNFNQIDDYAFGSGGMVLMPEPLEEALDSVLINNAKALVVYPTPQGTLLTQEIVTSLFNQSHVVIICGHYEGLDERFIEQKVDLEVTIGDCVLTGGEIPAMAIIDAVARLIPGVVGREEAVIEDSFYKNMLDYPHYTRPACWNGIDVPAVLLSGNAANISDWRRKQAVTRTISRRPDILVKSSLRDYMQNGFYVCFEGACFENEEYEFEDKEYEIDKNKFVSENYLKKLAGLCEIYKATRLLIIVNQPDIRDFIRQKVLNNVLNNNDNNKSNVFYGQDKIKLMPSIKYTLDWIIKKEKIKEKDTKRIVIVRICDKIFRNTVHWLEIKRLALEKNWVLLFYFSGSESDSDLEIEKSGIEKIEEKEKNINEFVVNMMPIEDGNFYLNKNIYEKFIVIMDRFLGRN